MVSLCLLLVKLLFITWWKCCLISSLYNYCFFFTLATDKQSVGDTFKIMQVSSPHKNLLLYLATNDDSCLIQSLLWWLWNYNSSNFLPLFIPVGTKHVESRILSSHLPVCLSLCPSIHLSTYLPTHLPTYHS